MAKEAAPEEALAVLSPVLDGSPVYLRLGVDYYVLAAHEKAGLNS